MASVRTFVNDFVKTNLDNFLHKNPETADALLRKILQAERERKELSGIRKLAKTAPKGVAAQQKTA
jgi:topoisomerase-4 subunit B